MSVQMLMSTDLWLTSGRWRIGRDRRSSQLHPGIPVNFSDEVNRIKIENVGQVCIYVAHISAIPRILFTRLSIRTTNYLVSGWP